MEITMLNKNFAASEHDHFFNDDSVFDDSFYTCNKYQMSGRQTPSEFLKQLIGKPVMVKLNSGLDYRGILACLDGYLNVALEQTEEYVNGQLKQKYGDAFIRGNNVLYISTQKRRA
ncbi:U6 snRNA-associated Sm-like protein LSm6 [Trichinella pseudospiralis]|uniref:U6 snRNA-associated Sm-like protein LSm6 n=2 Tax=Trichinella pseudospiralis TaxID=6337 RepID=A0A0V1JH96_TRIPS|nr:U6 snRNA-associated Sm-like protein LSm6 [Trichinella pseudospiralis]KRZ45679.1 U6 snRNA-associated Sm-like protein LSm6 [Trichinella pseudospiralis]